jgi:hypothetical protein
LRVVGLPASSSSIPILDAVASDKGGIKPFKEDDFISMVAKTIGTTRSFSEQARGDLGNR